ncbi:hypothetical protein DL764_004911 [Monosporascus ibericus]|uniref:WSC domain-containing protein n=1 Tax=Monosporascus ibericus TaxID=155417 RepID=A0A4V1XAS8_9PEZI|nr:hypothetical protein DL764_004911 [Monosporascus ibericus]
MASTVLLAALFGMVVQALVFDARPAKRTEVIPPSPTRAPYSCVQESAQCAFYTTAGVRAVGCYYEASAAAYGGGATCFDYQEIYSSSSCDNGCSQDAFTIKCTDTSAPYCGTISFFGGFIDYYCDDLDGSILQSAQTTYSGGPERTFGIITSPTLTSTSPTSPTTTATSTSTDPPSAPGGSSNTGVIVGGAVGGVGGIALISLLAFFLIRRNKNRNAQQPPQQPGYSPMQQQQQPGHPSTYNPGFQPPQQQYLPQQYPPQQYPSQQYPPQQGAHPPSYYPDQNKPADVVNTGVVPDRNQSTSPDSQVRDNRNTMPPTSPTSTVYSNHLPSQYGVQQHHYTSGVPPTVHEAGSNVIGQPGYLDNHPSQLHELPGQQNG